MKTNLATLFKLAIFHGTVLNSFFKSGDFKINKRMFKGMQWLHCTFKRRWMHMWNVKHALFSVLVYCMIDGVGYSDNVPTFYLRSHCNPCHWTLVMPAQCTKKHERYHRGEKVHVPPEAESLTRCNLRCKCNKMLDSLCSFEFSSVKCLVIQFVISISHINGLPVSPIETMLGVLLMLLVGVWPRTLTSANKGLLQATHIYLPATPCDLRCGVGLNYTLLPPSVNFVKFCIKYQLELISYVAFKMLIKSRYGDISQEEPCLGMECGPVGRWTGVVMPPMKGRLQEALPGLNDGQMGRLAFE